MFGQIKGVEMACNIRERSERGTDSCEANWSASFTDYGSEYKYRAGCRRQGSTCVHQTTWDTLHLSRMTIHWILMQELKMQRVCFVILFFVVLRGIPKTSFMQTAVTWDRVDIWRWVHALSTHLKMRYITEYLTLPIHAVLCPFLQWLMFFGTTLVFGKSAKNFVFVCSLL